MSRQPKRETENAKTLIQGKGLRATVSRIAVLELLMWRHQPMSHADVIESLGDEMWDRTTIYRNLVDLSRVGLLLRTEIGDRKWRFEFLNPEKHSEDEHPHFVCLECGKVECLPPLSINLPEEGWGPRAVRAGEYQVQLRGRCDRCSGVEEG